MEASAYVGLQRSSAKTHASVLNLSSVKGLKLKGEKQREN